jgi:hypothetical protein
VVSESRVVKHVGGRGYLKPAQVAPSETVFAAFVDNRCQSPLLAHSSPLFAQTLRLPGAWARHKSWTVSHAQRSSFTCISSGTKPWYRFALAFSFEGRFIRDKVQYSSQPSSHVRVGAAAVTSTFHPCQLLPLEVLRQCFGQLLCPLGTGSTLWTSAIKLMQEKENLNCSCYFFYRVFRLSHPKLACLGSPTTIRPLSS